MPLTIGSWVKRLTSSTTARNIQPGMLGRIGGLDPSMHANPVSDFTGYGLFPVQWQNGLWSSLDPFAEDEVWEGFNPLQPMADEEDD